MCRYLEQVPWDQVSQHEEKLQGILIDYLLSKPHIIRIWGEPVADRKKRVPVISWTVKGHSSRGIVEAIEAKSDFGCRFGAFYSNRLVAEVLGLDAVDGVVRVSLLHYNTGQSKYQRRRGQIANRVAEDEVRGFVKVLDEVISS